MEFNIKTRYIIIAVVLVLLLSFGAGYLVCQRSIEGRASEYLQRADDLEKQLITERNRAGQLTDSLRLTAIALGEAERTTQNLETTNIRLRATNKKLTEGIGNLGIGVGEDIERLEETLERLRGVLGISE